MLGFLLIDDWHLNNLRRTQAEQISQLEFASIAAEDVSPGLEPLQSDIPLELKSSEIAPLSEEKSAESKLFNRLKRLDAKNRTAENKLAAAKRRLRLVEAQKRELDDYLRQQSHWISAAMLGCLIAYVIFSRLGTKTPRE